VKRRNALKKISTLMAIAAALARFDSFAEAQSPAKLPKIGFLEARSASARNLELFKRDFREIGYIEGKNVAFESRYADDKVERLPALAEELVRRKVDAILTPGIVAALAAKNATSTIPIVCLNLADPTAAGLVNTIARPGGNVTGFTQLGAELAGKRLELLKETVPKLSRVAVLWNPQDPSSAQSWKESQVPARELSLQLHSMEVASADKYESAFQEAIKARSAALSVIGSLLNNSNQKLIIQLAAKSKLPTIGSREGFVEGGGLMAYASDRAEAYKRAAVMVDKILKGTKPADIPVEQPMKYELVINFKTAKMLGLTIPPIVLMRATRVVK
jgi:putative ABC transport system substrate-binding protein